MDNVYPITLKIKPSLWPHPMHVIADIRKYCENRSIEYCLYQEHATSNLHYHGIMSFPNETYRKRFQTWFNKTLGKIKTSVKSDYTDTAGWERYCRKASSGEVRGIDLPYLF